MIKPGGYASRFIPLVLCWLLAMQPYSFSQVRQPYQFTWLEGGPGTVNQSRAKRPVDLALRVTEEATGNPARGAEVTFFFPTVGATLQPPGGGTTVTAKTDDDGRVRIAGLIPLGSGAVSIRVTASLGGVIGSTVIQHSNVMPPVMTPAKWAIAGAGAAGLVTTLMYVYAWREPTPSRITLGPGSVPPR